MTKECPCNFEEGHCTQPSEASALLSEAFEQAFEQAFNEHGSALGKPPMTESEAQVVRQIMSRAYEIVFLQGDFMKVRGTPIGYGSIAHLNRRKVLTER